MAITAAAAWLTSSAIVQLKVGYSCSKSKCRRPEQLAIQNRLQNPVESRRDAGRKRPRCGRPRQIATAASPEQSRLCNCSRLQAMNPRQVVLSISETTGCLCAKCQVCSEPCRRRSPFKSQGLAWTNRQVHYRVTGITGITDNTDLYPKSLCF